MQSLPPSTAHTHQNWDLPQSYHTTRCNSEHMSLGIMGPDDFFAFHSVDNKVPVYIFDISTFTVESFSKFTDKKECHFYFEKSPVKRKRRQ